MRCSGDPDRGVRQGGEGGVAAGAERGDPVPQERGGGKRGERQGEGARQGEERRAQHLQGDRGGCLLSEQEFSLAVSVKYDGHKFFWALSCHF